MAGSFNVGLQAKVCYLILTARILRQDGRPDICFARRQQIKQACCQAGLTGSTDLTNNSMARGSILHASQKSFLQVSSKKQGLQQVWGLSYKLAPGADSEPKLLSTTPGSMRSFLTEREESLCREADWDPATCSFTSVLITQLKAKIDIQVNGSAGQM